MEERIETLIRLLKSYGAKKITIFGSYARGEAREGSDVDVLVEFEPRKSLLELVKIEQELENQLGIKVDLLTEASLSPYVREKIKKEARGSRRENGGEGKNMKRDVEELKQKILPILQRYGVKRVGVFGSYVRGDMREDSDIDILVEIDKDMSLLDFVGLKLELEESLGRKVDLVEYSTIKPLLRERILQEQVVIL